MAFTITALEAGAYSIKFLVEGDGAAVNATIDNAVLIAALAAEASPLRDVLSATYVDTPAVKAATVLTAAYDLQVEPGGPGGVDIVSWGADIERNKNGLIDLIIGASAANGNSFCYLKLVFNHTYVR